MNTVPAFHIADSQRGCILFVFFFNLFLTSFAISFNLLGGQILQQSKQIHSFLAECRSEHFRWVPDDPHTSHKAMFHDLLQHQHIMFSKFLKWFRTRYKTSARDVSPVPLRLFYLALWSIASSHHIATRPVAQTLGNEEIHNSRFFVAVFPSKRTQAIINVASAVSFQQLLVGIRFQLPSSIPASTFLICSITIHTRVSTFKLNFWVCFEKEMSQLTHWSGM